MLGGGYVITPMPEGKECIIRHMLAVDWKCWKSYVQKASTRDITISMLMRVAALRELFRAKAGKGSHEYLSEEGTSDIGVPLNDEIKTEVEVSKHVSGGATTLMGLSDAGDEFFDVPEPSDDEGEIPESCYVVIFYI